MPLDIHSCTNIKVFKWNPVNSVSAVINLHFIIPTLRSRSVVTSSKAPANCVPSVTRSFTGWHLLSEFPSVLDYRKPAMRSVPIIPNNL